MEAKVLPLTYFGNLAYFKLLLESESLWIDDCEIYLKQTYRNRTQILAANGILQLSVPVVSPKGKVIKVDEVEISYDDAWQSKHLKTIKSAYKSSPFYEEYELEIQGLISAKHHRLIDLNKAILKKVLYLLNIDKEINFVSEKKLPSDAISYRGFFKPSKTPGIFSDFKPYIQVFNYKFDFIPNLSILDLLFNEGPYALSYLKNSKTD